MTEIWTGHYEYDNNKLNVRTNLDKTFFSLTIDSFNTNNFTGIVNDKIGTGGMIDSWRIAGNLVDNKIFFKKFKSIKSDVVANDLLNMIDKTFPVIYFYGTITGNKIEITGNWKFKLQIGFLFGFIPILYRPGKGAWTMKLTN